MNRRLFLIGFLLCAAALAACTTVGEEPAVATTGPAAPAVPTAAPASPMATALAEPTAFPSPTSTTPTTPTPLPAARSTPSGVERLEPVVGPGLVQFYGLSPSGRYLSYAKYAPEDKEENPQFPPMTLHVRDLVEGSECAFDRELITVNIVWRPELSWRMDDTFLLVDESGGLWGGGPCPADLIPLSLAVPNGARNIAAVDAARDQFLLRGQDSYFLLRLGENGGVTPLPDEVPYGDWSNFAFSPDGAHLAFHLDSGGGLVVNLRTMSVVASVETAPISGLGDMPAPLWISNDEVILRSNPEIGPVVLNTAGGAQPLRVAGAEEGRQLFVLDAVQTDTEVILLLRSYDAAFSSASEMYSLYRVVVSPGGFTFSEGETMGQGFILAEGESLPSARNAALSPTGTHVVYTRATDGTFETMLSALAGGPETILWTGPQAVYEGFAPDGTLAVMHNARLRLFRGEEMLGEWQLEIFSFPATGSPVRWSADGSTVLVSAGFSGREERGLFALTVP